MSEDLTHAKVQAWLEQFSAAIRDGVPGDTNVTPGDLMLLVNFAWIGAYTSMALTTDDAAMEQSLTNEAMQHAAALGMFFGGGKDGSDGLVQAAAVTMEIIRGRYDEFCLGPEEEGSDE